MQIRSYKACLLDLDNTLYAYEPAHNAALEAAFSLLARHESFAQLSQDAARLYKAARKEIHEELHGQAASHSRILYFQRLLELASCSNLSFAGDLETVYWDTFLERIELSEGAENLLRFLRARGIKIAIVTDLTAQIQLRKLRKLGLEPLIDAFVSSEEAGVEKPETRIFHRACKKLAVVVEDAFVVGDSYERDVMGAVRLGVPGYWLCDVPSQEAQELVKGHPEGRVYPVATLAELQSILANHLSMRVEAIDV